MRGWSMSPYPSQSSELPTGPGTEIIELNKGGDLFGEIDAAEKWSWVQGGVSPGVGVDQDKVSWATWTALHSFHSHISEQGPSRPSGSESAPGVAVSMRTLVREGLNVAVTDEDKDEYCTGMQHSVRS